MPAKIEVRCNALQMMGRGRASEASETHCSACLFRDCMFSNTPFIILSTNWVKMGVILRVLVYTRTFYLHESSTQVNKHF